MKHPAFWTAAVLSLVLVTACTDNAVRLRRGVERSASRLYEGPDFRQEAVRYVPVAAPDKPYWLIFFPETRTRAEHLVQAGVPLAVADQIFRELGYVDVGRKPMLVVWQPGERLTFTGYHGRELVKIEGLIVANRTGPSEIVLEKRNETLYIVAVR